LLRLPLSLKVGQLNKINHAIIYVYLPGREKLYG